jgi:signal transduction histidine kinase
MPNGDAALVTLMTFRTREGPVSAIEMIERLHDEPWYEREAVTRTAVTTAIVIALCIGIILGFGVVFVGRPLSALRDHARRVGRGERAIRTELRSRDEIGELAADMNAMSLALDDARARVEAEEQARAVALAQLRHADRLRVVGEIASSVAHDLGTPMAAVRARSQMISGGEVGAARAQELAGANMVDIDRMSRRIRQLLDYARRDQPQREIVDIGQWIAATVDLLRPVSERRGVELSVRARAGSAALDAEQMRHVLMNLMTNAIEASPPGSKVVIQAETDERDLRIAVADAGPGIPADQVDQVFEPFFTTKPPGQGTGLGLSIARGIVHEHGGQIRVERGAHGTEFVVTVPVNAAAGAGSA